VGVSYKKEDITKQNVVIGQQNFAWWLGHSSEKGVSNHQKITVRRGRGSLNG